MKILLPLVSVLCYACASSQGYADYSASSGFELDSLDAVNSRVIENLGVTCRVWGYVKYHHPVFIKPALNADYELFELLPLVAHAAPAERNKLLYNWTKGLGEYRPIKNIKNKTDDIIRTADLRWMHDTLQLGDDLSALLQELRHARHKNNGFTAFTPYSGTLDMSNESTAGSLDDCGYRMLYLFRFWNAVEYYAPNRNLTETPWNEIPEKYIPLFIPSPSPGKQECALLQRELGDSHSVLCQYSMFGAKAIPVEVRNAGDRVFVTADGPLRKGDELLTIDGRDRQHTYDKLNRYEPASNEENRRYMTAKCMTYSHRDTATVEFVRGGNQMTAQIPTSDWEHWDPYSPERMLDESNVRLIANGVGYMTGLNYTGKNGNELFEKFRDTKALIVDMRCYPRAFMVFDFIGRHFLPQTTSHVMWVRPASMLPGTFTCEKAEMPVKPKAPGIENPDYYKGRVVVLVDSSTQSSAEYTTMAFQAAPRCTVVGTQTAGADGNVTALVMPGGTSGYFSGLGVRYPDGTDTQRAGVRIDVPVHPTVEGLQAGRDEILEKALEIIRTGQHDPAKTKG